MVESGVADVGKVESTGLVEDTKYRQKVSNYCLLAFRILMTFGPCHRVQHLGKTPLLRMSSTFP